MPDGVVQWFDSTAGKAAVVRGGRVFLANASDVESSARRPGSRVHFDIDRDGGIDHAVRVHLHHTRSTSSPGRRIGDLVGARRPDTKGPAPFARPHPELRDASAVRPVQVAKAWIGAVAAGDLETALALCSAEARLHIDGHTAGGRAGLQRALESSVLLGGTPGPVTVGGDEVVAVAFEPADGGTPCHVHLRVAHGLVEEISAHDAEASAATLPEIGRSIELVTRGSIHLADANSAVERVRAVLDRIAEPVLYARLKLTHAPDPARDRPDIAQATIDVGGDLVRAQVAAASMGEAASLLADRLRDQLRHRAAHRESVRKQLTPIGDRRRPERTVVPVDEREVVQLKSYSIAELTAEEAAFDMEQLDHDFYLFRELGTGRDACAYRRSDGGTEILREAPSLTIDDAVERLEAGGEPFVFFDDQATKRGAVVYHRYDGHYGVVTSG